MNLNNANENTVELLEEYFKIKRLERELKNQAFTFNLVSSDGSINIFLDLSPDEIKNIIAKRKEEMEELLKNI